MLTAMTLDAGSNQSVGLAARQVTARAGPLLAKRGPWAPLVFPPSGRVSAIVRRQGETDIRPKRLRQDRPSPPQVGQTQLRRFPVNRMSKTSSDAD